MSVIDSIFECFHVLEQYYVPYGILIVNTIQVYLDLSRALGRLFEIDALKNVAKNTNPCHLGQTP